MSNNSDSDSTSGTTLDQLAWACDATTRARYEAQKAEGVVNPIVLAQLLNVRPQMIYNYIAKGKFSQVENAFGTNSTQKKVIYLNEANTFAVGYLTRKVEREAKAAEKVSAELEGVKA